MKKYIILLAAFFYSYITILNAQVTLTNFPRPCGIYALGTLTGGATDIVDFSFVDGFVMRYEWTSLETARDVYNFSTIDKVVKKLDSLGQGLTLDIFRMKVPQYILNVQGVETYSLTVGSQTFKTAVPWDSFSNDRFKALLDAVANHEVFSISNNTLVKLKSHPVLRQIDGSPIGMNGIRDLSNQLIPLSSYNRSKFVKAIVNTAGDVITRFPDQFVFLAIFGINDKITQPTLTTFLRDTLMKVFNHGAIPKLGFFQENLACSTPVATISNTLYLKRDSTFTLNQMLQAWQNPFLNPTLTDACLTANGGPDVAILYGLSSFKSTYVEVYKVDLLYAPYQTMFQDIHGMLQNYCQSTVTRINEEEELGLKIYPNPATDFVTISVNRKITDKISVVIYTLLGHAVYSSDIQQGVNIIDISKLPAAVYFLAIRSQHYTVTQKFIIE